MTFAEKIRELRTKLGMSQTQLGEAVGVSLRTVRNWETEGRFPRSHAIYASLADTLGCDISYLMTDREDFITGAEESFGYRGRKGAQELMNEVTGLFAGGEMAEEDMDAFVLAIQQAYIDAKQKNRKYARRKTGSNDGGSDSGNNSGSNSGNKTVSSQGNDMPGGEH